MDTAKKLSKFYITHFFKVITLIFKLHRKEDKGKRNDKMTRKSKSKVFIMFNIGTRQLVFYL